MQAKSFVIDQIDNLDNSHSFYIYNSIKYLNAKVHKQVRR